MRSVGDLARIGNHTRTDIEVEDGVPERLPFQDLDGNPTVPDEAVLTVVLPDQTLSVFRWPTPGAGEGQLVAELDVPAGEENTRFYADVLYTQAGRWRAVLAGSGNVTTSEQITITVQRTYP